MTASSANRLRGEQQLPAIRSIFRTSILRGVALVLSLTLAGCNSEWLGARDRAAVANKTPPAPGYKSDIVALMRTYLNDPSGVRDAFISEPTLRSLENTERITVCLRYTARKDGGQYAPSKDSLVMFREGRVDHIVDAARETCKDAAYEPFPELERLKR
jgi:hypothetical protein